MIDLRDVELAINDLIIRNRAFGIPFEYPQAPLQSYPEDLWGKVTNLRGTGVPATLGPQGMDEFVGVIQVDINYPVGKGTSELLDKVTEVMRALKPGQLLQYGDMHLRTVGTSPSPEREVGGYVRISVSANYTLRTFRA